MKLINYLQNKPKRFLIFDLDETLVKLDINWDLYRQKLWKEYGASRDIYSPNILQNELVTQYGPDMVVSLKELNNQFEKENLKGYKVNDELVKFVKNNKQYTYYLWTANTIALAKKVLGEIGILDRFERIVSRDTVDYQKPNSEGFSQIYSKTESKNAYLFIGDSPTDKGACGSAGIDFFAVTFFK